MKGVALTRRNVGIIVCLLAVPLAGYILFTNWFSVDDVGITLRYAWNAASGEGIAFNPRSPDTRVQGCSTPVWFLITTFLALFTPTKILLLKTAYAVSIVFLALTALGIVKILDELPFEGHRLLFFLAAILTCFSFLYHHEIAYTIGMETPLFLGCILWGITWYTDERPGVRRRGLAVMMVGGLVRFEFAVIAAVIFLWDYSRRWRERSPWSSAGEVLFAPMSKLLRTVFFSIPWRNGLLYSLPILAWMAFSQWYFGEPLPWTLQVKLQEAGNLTRWEAFQEHMGMLFFDPAHRFLIPFILLGIWVVARNRGESHAHRVLFLLLTSVLVYAYVDFYLLKVPRDYPWYRSPLHMVLMLMAGTGIYFFGSRVQRFVMRHRTRLRITLAATVVTLGGFYTGIYLALESRTIYYRQYYNGGGLFQVARAAGEYLSEYDPHSRAKLYDIGVFSFFYDGYVADLVGLVVPREEARRSPAMYHIWLKGRELEPTLELVARFRGRWLDKRLGYAEAAIYRTPLGSAKRRWEETRRLRREREKSVPPPPELLDLPGKATPEVSSPE